MIVVDEKPILSILNSPIVRHFQDMLFAKLFGIMKWEKPCAKIRGTPARFIGTKTCLKSMAITNKHSDSCQPRINKPWFIN